MLEFDPHEMEPRDCYFLMTGLVVPRPIAWVSTIDRDGNRNLAPHSYYMACSTNPPIVHFTQSTLKDTIRNTFETEEFVINIVSHELGPAMRITSAAFPPDVDEFEWAGLTAAPSTVVKPPRVAEAKIALECSLRQLLFVGEGRMAFGDVLRVHVSEDVWVDGRIDYGRLRPVGRFGGNHYATIDETYRLPMPDRVRDAIGDYVIPGGPPE